jgi:hypothetical protein
MARINQFTRTVLLDRSNPGNIDAAFAAGGGNAARGYAQAAQQDFRNARVADAYLDEQMKAKQAEAKVKAQEKFNEFQRQRITAQQETQNERQANPTGYTKNFDEWHTQQLTDFESKLGEDGSTGEDAIDLEYYRQLVDRDRTQVFDANTNWENGQRVRNTFTGTEQNIEQMNVNFMMSKPTYKDFVKYQADMRNYVTEVGGTVLSPQDQVKLYEFGVDNAANAFFDEKLQDNPRSVKRLLNYGQGGQDAMIDFVMNDIEGGGRYVKDGGGYAKYGINSESNKDVDVKSLTPEKAVEIYKSRYWDKRLEEYTPAFQAVAFDALVNHGNDKDTWKMIEQANENPMALISLRQKEYARLVAENPEKYKKNETGWQNRLQKLTEYASDLEGGGAELLQHVQLVDPKILANVKSRLDSSIAAKDAQMAKEALESSHADTMTQINNQNTMLEEIQADDLTYDEKMLKLNRAEMTGDIRQDFAADSRRYLESAKAISAVTNSDKMAEVVTQMYDLNTMADVKEADYLRGMQNIKRNIMNLRSDGLLNRDDEEKLSNQMRTLMAAKQSEATSTIAMSFGDAGRIIDAGLPPELRGEATRALFYKVDEQTQSGVKMTREEEKALYSKHARGIVDEMNTARRTKALDTVAKANAAKNTIAPDDVETQKFLTAKGYTLDDVKETAKKHGISEKAVIERLKKQVQ